MNKRALITGITGQDGSYLAELLLSKGYEVHGFVRRASSVSTNRLAHILPQEHIDAPALTLHEGDMTDTASIMRVVDEVRPHEIYNLAAQSHVGTSFTASEYTADVDALGALRLLEAVRASRLTDFTRFYQASTSELFGKVRETPQSETTPFHPRSPYGVAKLFAHWTTINFRESYGVFACNGILFNHESPRRGENFVTRKITRGLSRVSQGLEACLYLGNLDSMRDWGHAKDFVEMQWMMLQQDEPDDYVVATGKQHSIREFLTWTAEELGMSLEFSGKGEEEIATIMAIDPEQDMMAQVGDVVVRIDKKFFRPAEVEALVGNYEKAKVELGWSPRMTARQLCVEMVGNDLNLARQEAQAQSGTTDRA